MEHQVYVLFSPTSNKIYIGYSQNVYERLKSHNGTSTKGYTAKYRPWVIIHTETFLDKHPALKREKELKTSRGRAFIRNLIQNNCTGSEVQLSFSLQQ